MDRQHTAQILAGALSGAIFYTAVSGLAGGFLFFYLPLLPLFLIGFGATLRAMGLATLAAMATSALLTGTAGLLLFAILQAAPGLLTIRQSLLWRDSGDAREWYPVGRILTSLAAYAAALFTIIAFHYSSTDGGLQAATIAEMSGAIKGVNPAYQVALEQFVTQWTFILIATMAWSWVLMIFACAWFAHFILRERSMLQRPTFRLEIFTPPLWLLAGLTLCALGSTLAAGQLEFIGKTLFMILLLPYFLLGIALISKASKAWAGRGLVLALMYFSILAMLWPAILIAGLGVARHCITLYKPSSANGKT